MEFRAAVKWLELREQDESESQKRRKKINDITAIKA